MSGSKEPFYTISPGELITTFLDYNGWSQSDLAEITDLSGKTISHLMSGKQNISADIALRLSKAFDKTPEFFINFFTKWQLYKNKQKNIPIETLTAEKARMHKYMPVAEINKKGWFLSDVSTLDGIKNEYKRLFNQDSLPETYYEKETPGMAARQTRENTELSKYYKNAWFSFAKFYARNVKIEKKYNKDLLKEIADNLYSYTMQENGIEKVLSDLETAGVVFFVLSHLSKTYLDGAAFIEGQNPFIVYTGRYNREDNFWFVLAHEIAHVICHYEYLENPFLDSFEDSNKAELTEREKEADRMAGEFLNQSKVLKLANQINKYVTEERLFRISRLSGVSVPVALGTMQHEGLVPWGNFNRYKPKVMEKIPDEYIKG